MSSILNFIKLGRLENLKLGDIRTVVEQMIGKPDGVSLSTKPIIAKYGSLEISYTDTGTDQLISSINLYFDDDFSVPNKVVVNGWAPPKCTDFQEFKTKCLDYGITLIKDDKHTIKDLQLGFNSSSGVVVVFNNNDGIYQLYGIHLG